MTWITWKPAYIVGGVSCFPISVGVGSEMEGVAISLFEPPRCMEPQVMGHRRIIRGKKNGPGLIYFSRLIDKHLQSCFTDTTRKLPAGKSLSCFDRQFCALLGEMRIDVVDVSTPFPFLRMRVRHYWLVKLTQIVCLAHTCGLRVHPDCAEVDSNEMSWET
uniref:Uncharacterized protein n=1 Tax=Octactis speculum TaxID=3111310 RepID=A0A7S2GTM3_9STRA|mmetsp:Transcript_5784/g.7154  ORF Transcript_5784/g.7154 Transcript_5784/m.7154 type:complete len:161 (+) Transcript_5784:1684-2166(+)